MHKIPTGNYIYSSITRWIRAKSGVTIQGNDATGRSVIEVPQGIALNFDVPNSIAPLLGFKKRKYEHSNELKFSEELVKIKPLNDIFVTCDLVTGSWDNGHLAKTIYTFYPDVPPGVKIVENARQLHYLPLFDNHMERLSNMTIRILDQEGNLIDFRGEPITITLFLK